VRWKQAFIHTLRDDPKDAEAPSHRLMMRAGFIRKVSAGVYAYLPLGFRSLNKASLIIQEEMNKAGATELVMPALHPAELWKATGRFEAIGEDLFSFKNRTETEYVLGPTHEEVITPLIAESVQSYKDLPITLYQIQVKFRDEARPRFGVIRSKEFLMKDGYSFDRDETGLDVSYQKMYDAYAKIFKRTGINFLIVSADSGHMGGKVSHEFMGRTPYGEDRVVICNSCDYVSSLEIARCPSKMAASKDEEKKLEEVVTPNVKTIDDLSKFFKADPRQFLKSIFYVADGKPVMVCLRGDHEINETKLKGALGVSELELATQEVVQESTKAPVGFLGPIGQKKIDIILDQGSAGGRNWVVGGNKEDVHLKNANLNRDFSVGNTCDIRYATKEDPCPKCGKETVIETTMELGHIFKLGTRYSQPLKAQYLDEDGKKKDIVMGCYGIGVGRILAAAIEQSHDDKGMVWPKNLAPFDIVILSFNEKSELIRKEAAQLEGELQSKGLDVLYDDRDERAGVKFNDADLIGIPLQVIVSDRNLKEKQLEVKIRKTGETQKISIQGAAEALQKIYNSL